MSALKTLISKYLSEKNLSRNQFARKLGYSNISKSLRNIDQYCLTLLDKDNLSSKLPLALNIPEDEFYKAVTEVQCHIENKNRLAFKPSIQVIVRGRPSPLFIAGLFPALWHVEMPDISHCKFEQELSIIFNAYKNHQLAINTEIYDVNNYLDYVQAIENMEKDNKKLSWSVGNGFRYFRQFDETLVFNRSGEILRHIKHHIEPIQVLVTLSGKKIPPSLIA